MCSNISNDLTSEQIKKAFASNFPAQICEGILSAGKEFQSELEKLTQHENHEVRETAKGRLQKLPR